MSRTKVALAVAVTVAAAAVVVAAPAASRAPTVISYTKTCYPDDHCHGDTGKGGTIDMQVTGFRATGKGGELSLTETVVEGSVSFTAELSGHQTAGFIVLNGTVTDGPFTGAHIHQRSDLDGFDGNNTLWSGELRLIEAST